MTQLLFLLSLTDFVKNVQNSERLPPGVNPNQYQDQVHYAESQNRQFNDQPSPHHHRQLDERVPPGVNPSQYQQQHIQREAPAQYQSKHQPNQHHSGHHGSLPPGVNPNQYQNQEHYDSIQNQQFNDQPSLQVDKRVPPGVNPNQYQQQHIEREQSGQQQSEYQSNQHHSGHQQHQSGQPNAQTDLHQHQAGSQQPTHQVAPKDMLGQLHHHGSAQHHQEGKRLPMDEKEIEHEKEHIAEHQAHVDTSKMSPEELTFHYFKMIDVDDNKLLDGTELVKLMIHTHNEHKEAKIFYDKELEDLIDPILDVDDKNKDGCIDYSEFMYSQKKRAQQKKKDTE